MTAIPEYVRRLSRTIAEDVANGTFWDNITDEADHLLVETSYFSEPVNFWETIDLIQCRGYHVVLAHPERYRYMDHRDYILLSGFMNPTFLVLIDAFVYTVANVLLTKRIEGKGV